MGRAWNIENRCAICGRCCCGSALRDLACDRVGVALSLVGNGKGRQKAHPLFIFMRGRG